MASDLEYQGYAILRLDGKELPTLNSGSLTPGGKTRTPVIGARVYGFKTGVAVATVTITIPHGAGVSIFDLKNAEDVTLDFFTSIGKTFLLPRAWSTGEESLSESGDITSTFNSVECKEV